MATGAWLGHFQDPRPIRRRGLLDVYACHEVQGLEPRVVLVGSPSADRETVCAALDAIAEAHTRVEAEAVPPIERRDRCGDIEYVSLLCDAVTDLERIFEELSRTGRKGVLGIGNRMMDTIHDALITAHKTPDPSGEPYALGALCWASVLVSPSGRPWLLGLGYNFPVRRARGTITVSPGMAEAPEVTVGMRPTPPSDVFAVYGLLRSMVPFAELSEALRASLSGNLTGEYGRLTRAIQHTNQTATAISPALRFQTIEELDDQLAATRAIYGDFADMEKSRAWFADRVREIVSAPSARTADEDVRQGHHWQGGRYRLERPLDSGATSLVWLAVDRQLEQQVAMKVLRTQHNAELRRRFFREIRILRAVRHRHLVGGYDFFEEDGRLVAVMEYVDGERLDQLIGILSADEVLSHGAALLDGLAALHAQGVVHRDVKPHNIIVGEKRGAVLVDFGIATEHDSDLTGTRPVGTLGYMAPEQRFGAPVTPAIDVYAMATVILEGVGGWDGLKPHVADVLRGALSADPKERPTAAAFAAAIRDQPAPQTPEETPSAALTVSADERRFVLPGGEEVDLSRRRATRAVLVQMIAQHEAHPGVPVAPDVLIQAGWPGERMTAESARGRLYVAIYTLRKMGFDEVFARVDDGYCVDESVRIERG